MVDATRDGSNSGGKTIEQALEEFKHSRSKGELPGNYVTEVDRVVGSWATWCKERDVFKLNDVDAWILRQWVQYLRRRVDGGGITGRTAHQYFALVRAFLSYCEEWEWITSNPAMQERITNELPDKSRGEGKKPQTWSESEREEIIRYVDQRAHEAVDNQGSDAVEECRDRALVYLLAFTGIRCAELVHDSNDDRRRGIYWSDIDYSNCTITVLGKDQKREKVQFPEIAHTAVQRYERVLNPPLDDWPVFPTSHSPSLYKTARDATDRDLNDDDVMTVLRETGTAPPSISTTAVRTILKDLCEKGDIDVEGDFEYLKPHGARRGLGKQLYKDSAFEYAQKALRHSDPETTSEMYADIEAGEVATVTDNVFGDDS
jgi:integrase